MKIFNKENGVDFVYVQREDLMYVLHYCLSIPNVLINDFFLETQDMTEENKDDFISFPNKSVIEFFKKLDWVIDYKEYRKLSMEDIMYKSTEITGDINKLNEALEKASSTDKKKLILARLAVVTYKAETIKNYYDYRDGLIDLEIPICIDSDGFSSKADTYQINDSLIPGKVLVHRSDGKPLDKHEEVPNNVIQMGMTMALMEHNPDDSTFNDYEKVNYRTKDNMYLVIGYDYRKTLPINFSINKPKKENIIQKALKKIRGK